MDRLTALQMHLNPVREKGEIIKRVKSDVFWTDVSVADLEKARIPLRGDYASPRASRFAGCPP